MVGHIFAKPTPRPRGNVGPLGQARPDRVTSGKLQELQVVQSPGIEDQDIEQAALQDDRPIGGVLSHDGLPPVIIQLSNDGTLGCSMKQTIQLLGVPP